MSECSRAEIVVTSFEGARIDWDAAAMRRFAGPIALVGRGLMSAIFILEGYEAIVNYQDVAAYMQGYGVSPNLLPLVMITELGGGLLILFGLKTRLAAIALAGFVLLAALLFHNNLADAEQAINFQKNLAIAGGFLFLAIFGPGSWSIDAWRGRQ
jgi:putative oxidoreductase